MGPQAARPDDQVHRAENSCGQEFLCQQNVEHEEMEGKEEFTAHDGCTSEGSSGFRSMVKLWDAKVVLQTPQRTVDQSLTAANAGNDRKKRCVTTQLAPDVSKNPRGGKAKSHPTLHSCESRERECVCAYRMSSFSQRW